MDVTIPQELLAQIAILKKSHKVLYYLDISSFCTDKLVSPGLIFRPLSRREFNFFSDEIKIDPIDTISNIIKKCVIYPEIDEYDLLAGIDEYVYNAIILYSGFQSEDVLADAVDRHRKYATSLEAAITMFICKAFPRYTPSDIDEMPLEEIIYLASLSEQILNIELKYLDYLHPELVKKDNHIPNKHKELLPKYKSQSYINPKLRNQADEPYETVITRENAAKEMAKMAEFLNGRT